MTPGERRLPRWAPGCALAGPEPGPETRGSRLRGSKHPISLFPSVVAPASGAQERARPGRWGRRWLHPPTHHYTSFPTPACLACIHSGPGRTPRWTRRGPGRGVVPREGKQLGAIANPLLKTKLRQGGSGTAAASSAGRSAGKMLAALRSDWGAGEIGIAPDRGQGRAGQDAGVRPGAGIPGPEEGECVPAAETLTALARSRLGLDQAEPRQRPVSSPGRARGRWGCFYSRGGTLKRKKNVCWRMGSKR